MRNYTQCAKCGDLVFGRNEPCARCERRSKYKYLPTVTKVLGHEPADYEEDRKVDCTVITLTPGEDGVTFDLLLRLSKSLKTRNINLTHCEQGYYGTHSQGQLQITVPPESSNAKR